jgi:uncharacterized protein (UPF0332 family)
MITGNDRKSLIDYRLTQAIDTLELADFLINNGKFSIAVNRIYYGMYYALTALALQFKYETSKHGQLIGWFNKEFIVTKKVDSVYGKIIRNAFQNRTKGDYDAFVTFTKEEVEFMLAEMSDFIAEIKRILNHENPVN